jgi:site-specific DNA-adenine methylase
MLIKQIIDRVQSGERSEFGLFPKEWYNFVTREQFMEIIKQTSPYATFVSICYSFGNNRRNYAFRNDLEPFKRHGHNFVMFQCQEGKQYLQNYFGENILHFLDIIECGKSWQDRRVLFCESIIKIEAIRVSRLYNDKVYNKYKNYTFKDCENLSQVSIFRDIVENIPEIKLKGNNARPTLRRLERLERLEQLEQLENINNLSNFTVLNKSYDQVSIITPEDETIIYIDPPYRNTGGYKVNEVNSFDHGKFDNWFTNLEFQAFLSEYDAPFEEVFAIRKEKLMKNTDIQERQYVVEKLYTNRGFAK